MHFLYILLSFVTYNPIIPLLDIPVNTQSMGFDERFPKGYDMEDIQRIGLFFYYLEQINRIESYPPISLEDVHRHPIIMEVLPLYDISPGKMSAGGLMDDWERNI